MLLSHIISQKTLKYRTNNGEAIFDTSVGEGSDEKIIISHFSGNTVFKHFFFVPERIRE